MQKYQPKLLNASVITLITMVTFITLVTETIARDQVRRWLYDILHFHLLFLISEYYFGSLLILFVISNIYDNLNQCKFNKTHLIGFDKRIHKKTKFLQSVYKQIKEFQTFFSKYNFLFEIVFFNPSD